MVTSAHKQAVNRWLDPLARRAVALGITPNAITLTVPVLVLLLCLWFVRTRLTLPFCVLVAAAGFLDGFDGAVARAGNRASAFGAYLDAMMDRYVEAMIAIAAAVVTGHWLLCTVVLAGGLMISYAKARAAMEVSVSNLEWPDLAERAERGAVFLIGLAAGAVVPWRPMGRDLFWWTLLVLAALIHFTVVQRMLRARGYIVGRTRKSG